MPDAVQEATRKRLVVVGAGLAGLAAAVRGVELGLEVLVLEAGPEEGYLCNSRLTMGFFHVAFRDPTAAPEDIQNWIREATDNEARADLVESVASNVGRALTWLSEKGVHFIRGGPHAWMSRVLAPPRVRRSGVHWKGRGGDVLLRRLKARLLEHGGKFRFGALAESLVMAQGHCVGIRFRSHGTIETIGADAVVLADGGFQANQDLVRQFISPRPEALCVRNAGTGVGAGLTMALEAGAGVSRLDRFYGHVQSYEALKSQRLWPYPVLDNLLVAGVVVDASGRRFADEGLGGIYMANAIARLENPLCAVVVVDDEIWNGIGRSVILAPNPAVQSAGGAVISRDTLPELATAVGVPPEHLLSTVEQHNAFVSTGTPPPGVPRTARAGAALPIQRGPFHALRACAGLTYTMGGISIDARARVLTPEEEVVPGLFAAGSTTGGLEGGGPAGYTGGLCKALVFGLLAAESAAKSGSASEGARLGLTRSLQD